MIFLEANVYRMLPCVPQFIRILSFNPEEMTLSPFYRWGKYSRILKINFMPDGNMGYCFHGKFKKHFDTNICKIKKTAD